MNDKKQSIWTSIKKWSTESLLISIIVGGIFGYSELKSYIQLHTFSTPQIKVLTETFIEQNLGIAGRENLEAQNQLTTKYIGLTTAIDTLSSVHRFVYNVLETGKLRDEAILSLVHRQDSIIMIQSEDIKQMKSDVFTIKTFNEALLIEIRKLKALENFNGN